MSALCPALSLPAAGWPSGVIVTPGYFYYPYYYGSFYPRVVSPYSLFLLSPTHCSG